MAVGLTLGFVGIAALAACGDDPASSATSAPAAVAVDDAGTPATTSLVIPVPTTQASDTSAVESTEVLLTTEGAGQWRGVPFPGSTDYVGAPLERVLSRTTDTGIVVHAYAWPGGGGSPWPIEGGPGWTPAAWCNPTTSLRFSMRLGDAVSIGHGSTYAEPFGGISVQAQVAGYAEGTPFTVLFVQAAPDVDRVVATFADGTVDSVETANGLALLGAPTAPAPEDMEWHEGPPPGPSYTLTLHRGENATEVASTDLRFPSEADYETSCQPPSELPAAGELPSDPAAAEQAVRDAFAAVFDTDGRAAGDRTWMQHLDSDEGVGTAIDAVLAGDFGSAAQGAEHTMDELVFTSPTEAWFSYDLFANDNHFDQRFGLALNIDGVWKISRGVICQDLALGGGACEPPIGPLYPPAD